MSVPPPLPSGTITFLFTDIEGSTKLLERLGEPYEAVLDDHRRLLGEAIAAGGGVEVGTEGDAVFAVFAAPSGALRAAVAGQRALAGHSWPEGVGLRVRMGLHTGEATLAGRDYVGLEVHRAARIAAAAHGGQVLVSHTTRALIEGALPEGVTMRDLGEHRLKDLSAPERIAQLVIDGLPAEFPPPRTLDAVPNNLPVQLTSFVGRTGDLSHAKRLLERTRLLTLTGPGGTGKTRLSIELAAEVAPDFPDGVTFVALAPIGDPALVGPTIAGALGLFGSQLPPLERIVEHLHDRAALLVLDNFEQVLSAAGIVGDLLRATRTVKVVVSSRAVLHISGEQEFPIPPLALPDPRHLPGIDSLSQFDAVRLFIERAIAARPGFAVTNENAPAVAEITTRLDGLPLAIELAAARTRILSPQAILERLSDSLSLLSGGARDLPERQQTIRGAIAWSHDLLDPAERKLFARLGVFVGGCTYDAADAICGPASELGIDTLDGLSSLVEKSLLRADEDAHGGSRFTMLMTIQAYARERLDEGGQLDEIRDRHALTYLDLVERIEPGLHTVERRSLFDRLEDDHDNIRAALDRLVEAGDAERAERLAAAVWRFWQARGHLIEGAERLGRVLGMETDSVRGARATRLHALAAAGGIAYWQGDLESTHTFYRGALEGARELGDPRELAEALYNISFAPVAVYGPVTGKTWFDLMAGEGRPFLEEALPIFRSIEDRRGIAKALWQMAELRSYAGEHAAADPEYSEALALFQELGDGFGAGWAYYTRGNGRNLLGDGGAARADFASALGLFHEAGDVTGIITLLMAIASIDREATPARACRLAGAATALEASSGSGLSRLVVDIPGFSLALTYPDDPVHRAAWEAGTSLSADEAVAEALGTRPPS
jgi:predicted ATPase/class 3 adenylate cyclase